MDVRTTALANGFRVITDRLPHLDTVACGVWVDAGARDETEAENGISHFLEHMLFKGTTTRSAIDLARAVENNGGYSNAFTDYEATAYFIGTSSVHAGTACGIIADMVLNSTFPEEELVREREIVLQEIGRYGDDPDDICANALRETALAAQSLGRPVLGPRENVAGFSREDLMVRIGSYDPGRMVLVASGKVDHDAISQLAEDLFASVARRPVRERAPLVHTGGVVHTAKDTEQMHLMAALPGGGLNDPRAFTFRHLAGILGGGVTSRLFQEVREKRGLVYDVHAGTEMYGDGGVLHVSAGTGPDKIDELVAVMFGEVARLRDGVTDEELARSKAQLRFAVGQSLESPMHRADRFSRYLLRTGKVWSLEETLAKIDAVTTDDVATLAHDLLAGPVAVSTLGPVEGPSLDTIQAILAA